MRAGRNVCKSRHPEFCCQTVKLAHEKEVVIRVLDFFKMRIWITPFSKPPRPIGICESKEHLECNVRKGVNEYYLVIYLQCWQNAIHPNTSVFKAS